MENYFLTEAGRDFLRDRYPTAKELREGSGIALNYAYSLLGKREATFTEKTLKKLKRAFEQFTQGEHYDILDASMPALKFIRGTASKPALRPTKTEVSGLIGLYAAMLSHPRFKNLDVDPLEDFIDWVGRWEEESVGYPAEQMFVYRLFQRKVVSLLFGEFRPKNINDPHGPALGLFPIWYLISDAVIPGPEIWSTLSESEKAYIEPVILSPEERHQFTVVPYTTNLVMRLLEELKPHINDGSLHFLVFELEPMPAQNNERSNVERNDNRRLRRFRQVQADVRQKLEGDELLSKAECYVMDYDYKVPRVNDKGRIFSDSLQLICCPLTKFYQERFIYDDENKTYNVEAEVLRDVLSSLLGGYWTHLEDGDPLKSKIKKWVDRELRFINRTVELRRPYRCRRLSE